MKLVVPIYYQDCVLKANFKCKMQITAVHYFLFNSSNFQFCSLAHEQYMTVLKQFLSRLFRYCSASKLFLYLYIAIIYLYVLHILLSAALHCFNFSDLFLVSFMLLSSEVSTS